MRVALISFTKKGADTCRKIEIGLDPEKFRCSAYGMKAFAEKAGIFPLEGSLSHWTEEAFSKENAVVFVGACGIAVRSIAPFVKDKALDPAVIVVDETGKYAISLLSGHLGGANDFTLEVARILGAEPVITTATDINDKFAVDTWAKKNGLWLGDMEIAKKISAAIINEEAIGVSSAYPIEGVLPESLFYQEAASDLKIGFNLSVHEDKKPFLQTLQLVPKILTIGIGCRKEIPLEAVQQLLYKVLKEQNISVHAIEKLCSIDIKKEEKALIQLAEQLDIPFQVFSSQELAKVDGKFTSSKFVNQITGVDNVCERAAVLGSQGELIVNRQVLNGVTVAIAIRKETFRWTWETDQED